MSAQHLIPGTHDSELIPQASTIIKHTRVLVERCVQESQNRAAIMEISRSISGYSVRSDSSDKQKMAHSLTTQGPSLLVDRRVFLKVLTCCRQYTYRIARAVRITNRRMHSLRSAKFGWCFLMMPI